MTYIVSEKLLVLSIISIIKISLSVQISNLKQKSNLDYFLVKIITLGLIFCIDDII